MNSSEIFARYDVPVPRYTSYPTVPYWSITPSREEWISELRKTLALPDSAWSLYLHIPFCETLCTFCGLNTVITKDLGASAPYVEDLLREWKIYLKEVPELASRPLRHFHLGGGSPNFLNETELKNLVGSLSNETNQDKKSFEGSWEADPRRTTSAQLRLLQGYGFDRVSFGVQDFEPEVLRKVNREQTEEETRSLVDAARALRYRSINLDLIYGLPGQTLESFSRTMEKVLSIRPDRLAIYGLAIVPWIKPAQKLFTEEELPRGKEKRELFELARNMLLKSGYIEIGMDHFALPEDALARASATGSLHRNFMGYSDIRTSAMLGLGVSAISETPGCYHQNEKVLPRYQNLVRYGDVPTLRGHLLSNDDRVARENILALMTCYEVSLGNRTEEARKFLEPLLSDGLVRVEDGYLRLTEAGRPFLRNACVFFDHHLRSKAPETRIFSSAV